MIAGFQKSVNESFWKQRPLCPADRSEGRQQMRLGCKQPCVKSYKDLSGQIAVNDPAGGDNTVYYTHAFAGPYPLP